MIEKLDKEIQDFWYQFLKEENLDKDTPLYEVFSFGGTEESQDYLLSLVLEGKKTATTSSIRGYEAIGKPLSKVGDYSIVLDSKEKPKCIIKTVETRKLLFNEMTYSLCKREGEDDDLESWFKGHRFYFKWEASQLDYEFSEDMPIWFEDFIVVYKGRI